MKFGGTKKGQTNDALTMNKKPVSKTNYKQKNINSS